MGRQPRQRPISCHLCRVRKLRCSRQFPCSNCTSRGVVCQQHGVAVTAIADNSATANATVAASQHGEPSPKDVTTLDLLSRLERLESLVAASQGKEKDQNAQRQAYPEPTPAKQPIAGSRPVPPRLQRLTADALQLERACDDQQSLMDCLVSDPIIFRTCPIRLAPSRPRYVFQNGVLPVVSDPLPGSMDATKCIWLPRRDEMRIVVHKYMVDIAAFHHIVHIPSLQNLVEDIYIALESNVRVDMGGILLLLSICASSTYAWSPPDDVRCLFSNSTEANAQSTFWIKQTLDVADQAQRTAHASLECVQGLITLFFVFCHHECVSRRAHNILLSAISMATAMSLHRLDDPQSSTIHGHMRMSEARKEIARRVWWYLASTDWMFAQFHSSQDGFYLIHKNQMAVNKPRNANDEDIIEGVEIVDRPVNEPTCISYFLQRTLLAEICNELLDQSPMSSPIPEPIAYKNILEADARINKFIQEVPGFLSLNNSNLSDLPPTDARRSPLIIVHRYTLNLLVHRQLCKMHLPYFAQGTVDPAYAYSREACLKSARIIIELDHQLQQANVPFFLSSMRMIMISRSVFLASITFVLNACLTDDSQQNGEGEDELTGALKHLQDAQSQSSTSPKLLELSAKILQKYNINHRALSFLQQQVSQLTPTFPSSVSCSMTPGSSHHDQRPRATLQSVSPDANSATPGQQWQTLGGRTESNTIDWDKIFWDLDAPFI